MQRHYATPAALDYTSSNEAEISPFPPISAPKERVFENHRPSLGRASSVDTMSRRMAGNSSIDTLNERKIIPWHVPGVHGERTRVETESRSIPSNLPHVSEIAIVAELSASIAHELNQPLAAVVSNAQACVRWLSNDPPNQQQAKEAAEKIVRIGHIAAEIVKRTTGLFRGVAPLKDVVDLNEVIREVLDSFAEKMVRQRIIVKTQLAKTANATTDHVQVRQVLVNLVKNAMDAMNDTNCVDRMLTVRSSQNGDGTLLVEVEDCGCGFVDSEQIFDAFFTTKEHGLGLGLAICRSIIKSHRGSLWAEQVLPCGSKFSFTLPIAFDS